MSRIYTAALAIIGDEILSGRTQDRNVVQIAQWLNVQGIRLAEVRVVPDIEEKIVKAVNELRAENDYLFTTGGIGPTHDDITVEAIAVALGKPVVEHPEARAMLERYYARIGGELTDARLRMARVPDGGELIPNPVSGAPGIRIDNVFIMAGIPHITAGMLEGLTGTLEGGNPLVSVSVGAFSPESEVAELLMDVMKAHPDTAIGSYPFFKDGKVGSNFVVRAEQEALAQACADDLAKRLDEAGYPSVPGGI
jgi:molybdenum cofactor synthesis domain-containing protein